MIWLFFFIVSERWMYPHLQSKTDYILFSWLSLTTTVPSSVCLPLVLVNQCETEIEVQTPCEMMILSYQWISIKLFCTFHYHLFILIRIIMMENQSIFQSFTLWIYRFVSLRLQKVFKWWRRGWGAVGGHLAWLFSSQRPGFNDET